MRIDKRGPKNRILSFVSFERKQKTKTNDDDDDDDENGAHTFEMLAFSLKKKTPSPQYFSMGIGLRSRTQLNDAMNE